MLPVEPPEGWRRIWIIALREIRERGGTRSYRISTAVAVLLVIAVIVLPSLAGTSNTYYVGFTGAVPEETAIALVGQAKAVGHQIETTRYPTLADGERAVRDSPLSRTVAPYSPTTRLQAVNRSFGQQRHHRLSYLVRTWPSVHSSRTPPHQGHRPVHRRAVSDETRVRHHDPRRPTLVPGLDQRPGNRSGGRQLRLLRAELGLDPPPATDERKTNRRKNIAA